VTRYQPLWLQAGSYAGSADRQLIAALWPTVATSGGAVSPVAGMQVQAAAGKVAVPVANPTGTVLCAWDAPELVTLDPSPPSGTNRIDLVIVQARGNDLDGGVNNDFVVTFVKGAEASSPVAPAVPANAAVLAQVAVNGGAASIVAGSITDRRPGALSIAPYGGSHHAAMVQRTSAFTFPATAQTWVIIPCNTVTNDPEGLYNTTTGLYTCPVDGLYQAIYKVSINGAASSFVNSAVYKNGATVGALSNAQGSFSSTLLSTGAAFVPCVKGDTLALWGATSIASASARGVDTQISIAYLGPN
jgi:C1q domain